MRRRRRNILIWSLLILMLAGSGYAVFKSGRGWERFFDTAPAVSQEEMVWQDICYTLPGNRWYLLEGALFDDPLKAEAFAEDFSKRGAAGYILKDEKGYHVLAAAYDRRLTAMEVQDNLNTYHQVKTCISQWVRPDIKIACQGEKEKVSALCDTLDFLCSLENQMYALSTGTDRGETDRKTAEENLLSQLETARSLQKRLSRCFRKNEETHVSFLRAQSMLEDVTGSLEKALERNISRVIMGSRIKACHLTAAFHLQALAEEMEKSFFNPL